MADWEVIQGDCLDAMRGMADASVDAVICDPPYSETTHAGARTVSDPDSPSLTTFASISEDDLRARLAECGRISRRWVVATVDWRHIQRMETDPIPGLRFVRFGVWLKTNGAPQFTGDRPSTGWEAIVYLHRAGEKLRWNGGGGHGNYVGPKVNGEHPTTKPLPLLAQWVQWFTEPGDLILDPFCGSGTTGVAAIKAGRRFVGVEMDPGYAALARRRLRGAEMPLFA